MDNILPSEFDIIIIGTGMVESIVSAAASRVGKKVLHIDKNDFYGGHWASFNLEVLKNFSNVNVEKQNDHVSEKVNSDEFVEFGNNFFNIEGLVTKWHIPGESEKDDSKECDPNRTEEKIFSVAEKNENQSKCEENIFTQQSLLKDCRKFNIDFMPKLHFARGDYVELLISSNIARYSEYRSVSRVLTWLNGHLEVVPCSRSDVFTNNKVSVIEKRMLMKLLTSLDGKNEEKDYENKTFHTFLKEKKLTPNLIHYVLYSISMSTDNTPCKEGIENTRRFLNSLGRFGKTPFLFASYGSGESPQAFCRLSAVFGGIFALNQPLTGFVLSDNKFTALVCGKQHLRADNFVMGIEKAPEKYVKCIEKEYISRAVFITDRSLMDSDKEHLTLLVYPPENEKYPVTIIELGYLTGTCPKNLYLVHFISRQKTNPEEDFKHIVNNLFTSDFKQENVGRNGKPQILWSCYFSLPDTSQSNLKVGQPENVVLCPGPDMDLDYDLSVKKAKQIFNELYPEEEFLPRAPDPEEIVIEGEDENVEHSSDENQQDKSDKQVHEGIEAK